MVKQTAIDRALEERERLWSFVSEFIGYEIELYTPDREAVDEFINEMQPEIFTTNQILEDSRD